MDEMIDIVRGLMTGEYFSPKYAESAYPRSELARQLSSAAEFLKAARRSVDSRSSLARDQLKRVSCWQAC